MPAWITLAAAKRLALPILLAILAAVATGFAWRADSLGKDVKALAVRVDHEETERKRAEQQLKDLREQSARADKASEANQDRMRALEDALATRKGEIDALERKYGATPVSDLSSRYLGELRTRQQRR